MDRLEQVLKQIVEKNSVVNRVFLYDPLGIFQEILEQNAGNWRVGLFQEASVLKWQAYWRGLAPDVKAVYSSRKLDWDKLRIYGQMSILELTPDVLLSSLGSFRSDADQSVRLIPSQFQLLAERFAFAAGQLEQSPKVHTKAVLRILIQSLAEKPIRADELLCALLKQSKWTEQLNAYGLADTALEWITEELDIDYISFIGAERPLLCLLATWTKRQNPQVLGAQYDCWVMPVCDASFQNFIHFLMQHADELEEEIEEANEYFRKVQVYEPVETVPALFENYIAQYLKDYKNIKLDGLTLWTESMREVGGFVASLSALDRMLAERVHYVFDDNRLDAVVKEYKEKLFCIDSGYRELCALRAKLKYRFSFYPKADAEQVFEQVSRQYFNVIQNINSKFIRSFQAQNTGKLIPQTDILHTIPFRRDTVFFFADGFRYEMAKEISLLWKDVSDYDVLALLPTETEIGMNSYFITDETVQLNEKNTFELMKDGKAVRQVMRWRKEKLEQILGQPAEWFGDFCEMPEVHGPVLYFYNAADVIMHRFDDVLMMERAKKDLAKAIRYCLGRGYDVMLLADHGFLEIGGKIHHQDMELDLEKKKDRYAILPEGETADRMYYISDLPTAGFLQTGSRHICFINSVNTLRQAGRYTHGGISLQEAVVPAMLFHAPQKENEKGEPVL